MIAAPTTAQLLDAVRRDLEERVAPAVADANARRALDMAILVLRSAAARSDHELAWMIEEAEAVEALAGAEPADGAVRSLADVHARYARASELLARAAEAAYDAGDEDAIRDVLALFEQRRANQNTITGGFEAVGRG